MSSTEWWSNGGNAGYHNQAWHVPYPPGFGGVGYGSDDPDGFHHRPTATKEIQLSIHVWLRDEGDFNYVDNPYNRLRLGQMVQWVSENYLENVALPSDPAIPDIGYYLQNTRLRLKLADIVFRNNTYWWSAGGGQSCTLQTVMTGATAAVLQDRPDLKNTLILHIMGSHSCPTTGAVDPSTGVFVWNYSGPQSSGTASGPAFGIMSWDNAPWVVVRGSQNPSFPWSPGDSQWGAMGVQWAHEIMHALGLTHLYDLSAPPNPGFNFMPDVFSCYQQQPWCAAVATPCANGQLPMAFCLLNDLNGCDAGATAFDACTNNVMGYGTGRHVSNLQMGRMHRSLVATQVSKAAEGYNADAILGFPVANMPPGAVFTWDFPMKVYQDVRVRSGQMLKITCRTELVQQAKIVVEPGGVLLIDGGTLTNASYNAAAGYYNPPFRGIEVWGNANQGQQNGTVTWWQGWPYAITNLAHQGLVVIRNGGIVENAETGVYLGKPGDPTRAGGVIRFEGTADNPPGVIRNCRTGVKFDPYASLSSNGLVALNNRSTFTHARFEWTEDFDNIHGSNNPIALADLNGVRVSFRGCAFEHSGQYPQYSSQLGYGIKAYNSTVWVNAVCPNGTINCQVASQLPCTFTGLDHGVHATASTSLPRLTVHRAQFTSNVCGVYGEGLRNATVRNCSFNVGERAVTLDTEEEEYWLGFHRGIFFTHCNGLRVIDNTLVEASEPAAPTEGIVIGYTNTASESIRSNAVSGMDRGYVGEGVSANTGNPAAIGLQFLCNTNNANGWNIWSRQAQGAPSWESPQHTIRLNQGWQNVPALNYLDNGIGSNVDVRVTTLSPITYWQVSAPHYAVGNFVGPVLPTLSGPQVLYGCPIIISGATDQLALQGEVEQARQAYAGLRYLYGNLIDGGSTDVVLDEIASAWPQDYWDLRAYLLSKSPYLSVDVLKEAMEKEGFPDAMRAEICIANPEATQKEGFLKWLETECSQPLPEALLEAIEASWSAKTYRATLEMQMGQEHLRMSEAAYALAELLAEDDEENGTDQAEELGALQLLRTAEARYDEALLLLGRHQYAQARALVTALPGEHALKGKQVDERAHMMWYIDFLEAVQLDGRTEAQLTPSEIAQLQAFIAVEHDRPTQWASHLLCYHYGICRSPYTGDAGAEPKARGRRPVVAAKEQARLGVKPNPANAWVVFTCELPDLTGEAQLIVRDMMGRESWRAAISRGNDQVLMDTRGLPAGAYTAEVVQGKSRLLPAERLIVQP